MMKFSTALLLALALVGTSVSAESAGLRNAESTSEDEAAEMMELDYHRMLQVGKHHTPAPTKAPVAPTPSPPTSVSVTCFTGDSLVMTQNKGMIELQDLEVHDLVYTGANGGDYEPVYAMGHYAPKNWGEFLYVSTTADNGHDDDEVLKLTGEHLVFVHGHDNPIRASALKVGDQLLRAPIAGIVGNATTETASTITSIDIRLRQGMYTPLTRSGKLVVNGYMASTYIAMQSKKEEDAEFVTMPWGKSSMSHQTFVDWTLAPFRVICGTSAGSIIDSWCDLTNDEGIPGFIHWGIGAVQWAHERSASMETFFLFWAFVLFGISHMIEMVINTDNNVLIGSVMAMVVGVMMLRGNNKNKKNKNTVM
jgi:hypothetical protein